MLKKAKFSLIKDEQEEINELINMIIKDNEYSFKIANFKMILNDRLFERENDEYKLLLNIIEKTCLLHLKEHDVDCEIEVEKIEYNKYDNKIELIYKLETDDSEIKIIIEQGE